MILFFCFCSHFTGGKLSQRDKKQMTCVILNREELLDMLLSPAYEVNDLFFANEDTVWMSYQLSEEGRKSDINRQQKNLSLITGAYTTAHGRLLIYKELSKLQERCCYADTDCAYSLCNKDIPNEYRTPISSNIGGFTDEISSKYGRDAYVKSFCAVGPKSYCIKVQVNPEKIVEICKLKGFMSTPENSKILNFAAYEKMVRGCSDTGLYESFTIQSCNRKIERRKWFDVVTTDVKKKFGFTFDKRIILRDFSTIPYGYQKK